MDFEYHDKDNLLGYKFELEFYNMKKKFGWYSFIKHKYIGIICHDYYNRIYIITDKKKWLLAKLKYGF